MSPSSCWPVTGFALGHLTGKRVARRQRTGHAPLPALALLPDGLECVRRLGINGCGAAHGVPLATIYRLFGSKRGILTAVLDVSFVGDDEPVALHDRPLAQEAFAETDPQRQLWRFRPAVPRGARSLR